MESGKDDLIQAHMHWGPAYLPWDYKGVTPLRKPDFTILLFLKT